MTAPSKPSADSVTPGQPGRVLLVDDQDELRQLLRRTLVKDGHDVTSASNGRVAVELAKAHHFDAVISDVRMPDMGGVELLRELQQHDPNLPVLLISGSPDLETAMKAVEYGALEYLVKPVAFDKLRASVRRAVDLRRQRARDHEVIEQHRSSGRQPRSSRPVERTSWTGEWLANRYRVGRLLGRGGMGSVYEAVREDLGHMRVAVKVLHDSLANDESLLARFRREAETVGQLNHPNVVKILDFHANPGEPVFFVMELLDGVSLRQELMRQRLFSAPRTVFIARQILAALAAVHRVNVIHRDVKPDNVFLTTVSGLGDIVKLLDFGVAKVLSAAPGETLTQAGTVLGTPTYMAPEQARGAPIDSRSDLYSVAAIMYEALTGHAPYSGDNYNALLFAIQRGEPEPLVDVRPDLDPELIEVIKKGMATDANARFRTAEEMAEALLPWQSLEASSTPPESSAVAFAPTVVPRHQR